MCCHELRLYPKNRQLDLYIVWCWGVAAGFTWPAGDQANACIARPVHCMALGVWRPVKDGHLDRMNSFLASAGLQAADMCGQGAEGESCND